jgi:hypothetical protein
VREREVKKLRIESAPTMTQDVNSGAKVNQK